MCSAQQSPLEFNRNKDVYQTLSDIGFNSKLLNLGLSFEEIVSLKVRCTVYLKHPGQIYFIARNAKAF